MKSFLILTVALSAALPLAAHAKDSDEKKWKKRQVAQAEQRAAESSAGISKFSAKKSNFSNAGGQQRTFRSVEQSQRRTQLADSNVNAYKRAKIQALNSNLNGSARVRSGNSANWQQSQSNAQIAQSNQRNWQGNNNRNWQSNNSNWQGSNNSNWQGNQRNWQGRNRASLYADSLRHRKHHHRDWWRRNFSRFALVNGGYWYWNSGFWYPAWGYDSSYNSYAYDGPIYGYNDLLPHQVVANVQIELQRQGYYRGAVDGDFGPLTQEALANYQADHGLQVSATVDRQTLRALGLA